MFGNTLSETYAVSPQISPEDIPAIKAAGFDTIICNRPDAEVPASLSADALRAVVEAEGLTFVENPFSPAAFGIGLVDVQEAAIGEGGKVLAYCASGNRSSILWAMTQARSGAKSPAQIIEAAAKAGYDQRGLLPQLQALAP